MKKPMTWALLLLWALVSMMTAVPVAHADPDLIILGDEIMGDIENLETMTEEIDLSTLGVQRGTELVIASSIAMSGQFGTEMWGNNSADMDVRAILHGYETVCMTAEGFTLNSTVIADVRTVPQGDGSVVYTLQLQEGLRYNDGSAITARDYAFYFLLSGAPQIEEIGGTTLGMKHIVGYDAYCAGETNVLSGVRILSDTVMEIRITGVSFPYFYGIALLNAKPYPIAAIIPDCAVMDDGAGVYVSGAFTAERLKEALLDPETGYQAFPQVTSGAYMLESYDRETNEARFRVNENFMGNYEGQTPHIERIVFRHVAEKDMLSALVDGEVDMLNKVTDASASQRIWAMIAERDAQAAAQGSDKEAAGMNQASYLRTGLGFLAFACESSKVGSSSLRRAVAMGLDKDALVESAVPGSALRVYGYYGLGQWMASYTDEGDEANKVAPLNVMERLSGFDVPMNLAEAAALLEADGWMLNGQGQPYDGEQGGVRCRNRDGMLEPLTLRLAVTEDDPIAAQVKAQLSSAMSALGIDLLVDEIPFPQLLDHYYRQTAREYDMFFMASNFSYVFDPYYDFNTDEAYQGMVNASGLKDEELMMLGRSMRETEPQNLREYVEKWLAFQERFVALMPMIPLYSNVYYDFYTEDLANYNISGISNWSSAILYAYMVDHEG